MDEPQPVVIKKDYQSSLQEFLSNPNTIDSICAYVAEGGTLITLADTLGLRYSDITRWIHADAERSKRYDKALADRVEWAQERILHELRLMALSDPKNAYNPRGGLLDMNEIPEGTRRAIKSIEVFEEFHGKGDERELIGYTKKIQFWDKTKAVELAGKQLGLFVDHHKIEIGAKLEDIVAMNYDEAEIVIKKEGGEHAKEEETQGILTEDSDNITRSKDNE